MRIREWILKHHKALVTGLIILSVPGIYFFVYYTGGIKFVYSHTMYIPIVLAGIVIGSPCGMIVALIGGILLGPLMPIDVLNSEPQEMINWIYRLLMFLAIGALSDYFSGSFKKALALNKQLYSVNLETHVPNINYLQNLPDDEKLYSVASIIISDRSNIEDVFGYEVFKKVVNITFLHLMTKIGKDTQVVQSDSNKLWLLMPVDNLKLNAERILAALSEPLIIDEIKIFVEYYIGLAKAASLNECKGLTPFRESDHYAKYAEKNNLPYVIYDESLIQKKFHIELLSEFQSALEQNETYLAYHPLYELETLTIYGFEALIRWNHPQRGLIMPGDFIPLVEKTQLIFSLLDWVLTTGFNKVNEMKKAKIKPRVAFNISGKNFNDKNLFQRILNNIEESNVAPESIGIEITETVLMNNPDASKSVIKKLRDKGIHIAIDDFGQGYSSLTYLSQFDIDLVKIDRYFISNLDDESILLIVKATINLAHQLGYKVVAEGVETKEVLDIIKKLGCDFAQGFYFCRPIHQDEVIAFYKKNKKFIPEEFDETQSSGE